MAKEHKKGHPAAGRSAPNKGKANDTKRRAVHRQSGERGSTNYPGRTIGGSATSYSSVGGKGEPLHSGQPESDVEAIHDVTFRPAPGGVLEERGRRGADIPFTGEISSTRGSTFEEDPDTGRTADEEDGEFITRSLEERTRGYEGG